MNDPDWLPPARPPGQMMNEACGSSLPLSLKTQNLRLRKAKESPASPPPGVTPPGRLGLRASFDAMTGYLVVTGTPNLGIDTAGSESYDRGDVRVFTHKVVSRAGVETSGYYYPKEGDRIICLNYVSFRPPTNWLEVDPPGPARSWIADGRRMLWKDFLERLWHRQAEKATSMNPTYLELERGVSGWLGTTWEAFGVALNWSPSVSEANFDKDLYDVEGLLGGFGMCIDSRDWSLAFVQDGSVAGRLGLARGSSVVKFNGESVQRRNIRSFLSGLEGAEELSLAVLRTNEDGRITGFNVVMKVADIVSRLPSSESNGQTPCALGASGQLLAALCTKGLTMESEGLAGKSEAALMKGVEGDAQLRAEPGNEFETPRDHMINDRAARWTVYTPPAGVHSDRLWPEDVGLSIVSVPESKVVSAIEEKKIKEGQAAGREHTFGFNVAANRPENATSRGCVGRIAEEGAGGRDGISAAVDNIVAIVKGGVISIDGDQGWPAPLDAGSNLAHITSASAPIVVNSRKKGDKKAGKKKGDGPIGVEALRARLEELERERDAHKETISLLQARLAEEVDTVSPPLSSESINEEQRGMDAESLHDLHANSQPFMSMHNMNGVQDLSAHDLSTTHVNGPEAGEVGCTSNGAHLNGHRVWVPRLDLSILHSDVQFWTKDGVSGRAGSAAQRAFSEAAANARQMLEYWVSENNGVWSKVETRDRDSDVFDFEVPRVEGGSGPILCESSQKNASGTADDFVKCMMRLVEAGEAAGGCRGDSPLEVGELDDTIAEELSPSDKMLQEVVRLRERVSELEKVAEAAKISVRAAARNEVWQDCSEAKHIAHISPSPRHSGSGRPPVSPLLGQIFGFARHGHKFESRSVAGRRSSAPGKIEATTEAFGKGRGEDGAAKDIRLLAVTLERCEGSVALLSALRRLTWNLEVVGSSICDAQTETDLVGLVGQAACDVECSFGMGSSDIAKIVELNDEVMLLKNAAVTRGGQELYVMELKKEIQVLRLRLKEGLHSQERVGNLELQVSELWLSRQELASCRELVVELEREVEGLRRKDVGGADNGASAACARVTELEREMMDLQRHCANLEQQRDRAVSDGSVQADLAREVEARLAEVVSNFEREKLVLAEELEGVKGSLTEEREAAERLKGDVERSRKDRAQAVREINFERQRVEMLRKELESTRDREEGISSAVRCGVSSLGTKSDSSGTASRGDKRQKGGVRELTEDELMELLNKAWEDGREAAEKRLAYERKQMEERWKAMKDGKQGEQKAKSVIKAITERRVW